jgi:hypothetical protein
MHVEQEIRVIRKLGERHVCRRPGGNGCPHSDHYRTREVFPGDLGRLAGPDALGQHLPG